MDWYVVVPLPDSEPGQLVGTTVFVVETTDSDLAAQVAFDQGYGRCAVLVAEFHEEAP